MIKINKKLIIKYVKAHCQLDSLCSANRESRIAIGNRGLNCPMSCLNLSQGLLAIFSYQLFRATKPTSLACLLASDGKR